MARKVTLENDDGSSYSIELLKAIVATCYCIVVNKWPMYR